MDRLEQMLAFLASDPGDSFARYAVALEHISRRDLDKAIEQLEELRRRDPEYVATYYQLGGVYATREEVDNAERAYNEGIEVARRAGDLHTVSELQAALDDLDALR
jgi:Tfp pilus assembly protein PilF